MFVIATTVHVIVINALVTAIMHVLAIAHTIKFKLLISYSNNLIITLRRFRDQDLTFPDRPSYSKRVNQPPIAYQES